MANDRIMIKCRHCGESMMFAKYYPTIGHGFWGDRHIQRLDAFVEQHMRCSPHFGENFLEGDRCFDLEVEAPEEVELPDIPMHQH